MGKSVDDPIEEVASEIEEKPGDSDLVEETVEPIEEVVPKSKKKEEDPRTQAQIEAGQTIEEARLYPVEGAQIHNIK